MAWKDRFVKKESVKEKKTEVRESIQEQIEPEYEPKVTQPKWSPESIDFSDPFPDKRAEKPEEPVKEEAVPETNEVTRTDDDFWKQQEIVKKLAERYRTASTKRVDTPADNEKDEFELDTDWKSIAPRQIEKKTLRIGIVLDCTSSFSTVYPAVYGVLKRFFTRLEQDKDQYRGFQLQYSLTLLHDKPEVFLFDGIAGPSRWSRFEKDVLSALETLEFYGGSDTGRENLNDALKKQLKILSPSHAEDEENVYKGLLFFTDSLPEDEELNPDLDEEEFEYDGRTCKNPGLRFAEIYSYDGSYRPNLRMVDRNGWADSENGRNEADYYNIHALLDGSTAKIAEDAERLINNIIIQASFPTSVK